MTTMIRSIVLRALMLMICAVGLGLGHDIAFRRNLSVDEAQPTNREYLSPDKQRNSQLNYSLLSHALPRMRAEVEQFDQYLAKDTAFVGLTLRERYPLLYGGGSNVDGKGTLNPSSETNTSASSGSGVPRASGILLHQPQQQQRQQHQTQQSEQLQHVSRKVQLLGTRSSSSYSRPEPEEDDAEDSEGVAAGESYRQLLPYSRASYNRPQDRSAVAHGAASYDALVSTSGRPGVGLHSPRALAPLMTAFGRQPAAALRSRQKSAFSNQANAATASGEPKQLDATGTPPGHARQPVVWAPPARLATSDSSKQPGYAGSARSSPTSGSSTQTTSAGPVETGDSHIVGLADTRPISSVDFSGELGSPFRYGAQLAAQRRLNYAKPVSVPTRVLHAYSKSAKTVLTQPTGTKNQQFGLSTEGSHDPSRFGYRKLLDLGQFSAEHVAVAGVTAKPTDAGILKQPAVTEGKGYDASGTNREEVAAKETIGGYSLLKSRSATTSTQGAASEDYLGSIPLSEVSRGRSVLSRLAWDRNISADGATRWWQPGIDNRPFPRKASSDAASAASISRTELPDPNAAAATLLLEASAAGIRRRNPDHYGSLLQRFA